MFDKTVHECTLDTLLNELDDIVLDAQRNPTLPIQYKFPF